MHKLKEIQNLKGEEWKVIKGACSDIRKGYKYYISNKGRVFSEYKGLMAVLTNRAGYKYIRMKILINGQYIYKQQFIHRLVAFYFCEGYKKGLVVNHKDENPGNNNCDNLEWITQKENCNYGNRNIKAKNTKMIKNSLENYKYLVLGIIIAQNQNKSYLKAI